MDRDIIRRNRKSLHSVREWITPEDYDNSRSHYGCPRRVLPLLNLPIDDQPTYSDMLVYAARRLPGPGRYLELGVSVGKNFYVLANALNRATLVGFDWERMSPALARRFEFTHADGRLQWYRYRRNRIGYLQGDIESAQDWASLAGLRFNLVLSDACHRPEMLRREFSMLERFELLDPAGFVIVWDDLDRLAAGPVTRAYQDIVDALRRRYHLAAAAAFRLELNGWLGQHEHRHTVGVISSVGLTRSAFA